MTETEIKRGTVLTKTGKVVSIVLTEASGLPHVTFMGASGSHTILVSDSVGGARRAVAHAGGFFADVAYGIPDRADQETIGRALVASVMTLPKDEAAKLTVRFEFAQTETTGYVRVWAHFNGKRYKVATAWTSRRSRRFGLVRPAGSYVLGSVPKAVAAAAEVAKVGERAKAMAERFTRGR